MKTLSCPRRFSAFWKGGKRLGSLVCVFLAFGSPVALAQDAVDLESDLELYWTFDEGFGDMAGDLSNQNRWGTFLDDPAFAESEILWTDGRFGGAVEFDLTYFLAANGYYGIGGTDPRTISLWLRTDWLSNNQGVLVAFGPNVNTERWHFKIHGADADGNAPIRTENQGGNNFGAIPVNDGEWRHVVCVFPEGGATVGDVDHYIDGVFEEAKNGGIGNPVNTNVDPALGAPLLSVGGSIFGGGFRYTQAVIDEVRVYSRALSVAEIEALASGDGVFDGAPPSIGFPDGFVGNPFVDTEEPVEIEVTAIGDATLDPADVSVALNGVPAEDGVSVEGSGADWTVVISDLESNLDYELTITAVDSDGLSVTRGARFSTYSFDNFVIEAENYNFGGGLFIDNPILCDTFGGEEDCYFDAISVPGVDAFDGNGADDNSDSLDIYRYSTGGADREEDFDTIPSGDLTREEYDDTGISEYDVDLMSAGDWANYTRTFDAGSSFRIFLRASTGANQQFRLDRVVSGADTADQELELLGFFNVVGAPGYGFTTLTDATGAADLTVAFSGEETLRLTSVDGANNANLNYLMFVPSSVSTILPTVAITSPEASALLPEDQEITIAVDAADEDGSVVSVELFSVEGDTRTSLALIDSAPFVVALPSLPSGALTLVAEAVDNSGLVGVSEAVNVVVDSTPLVLGAVRGSPNLDAIELLFDDSVPADAGADEGLYSISPSLAIDEVLVDRNRVTLLTGDQSSGTTYTVTVSGLPDENGVVLDSATGSFEAATENLLYGLDGYWPLDEGAGNVAFDIAGAGHDAGIYDVPQYADAAVLHTAGRFGGAINFDGSYFLGTPSYYGVGGSNPRTISLWLNTSIETVGGANAIVGWGSGANTARYHFKLEGSNGVTLRTENAGGNNFGSVSVNTGEWIHIAAVFEGDDDAVGAVDHFINAILDEEKNGGIGNPVDTNITPGVAAPFTIGGAPLGLGGSLRPVVALLDDVRIYNRALSEEELEALAAGEGVLDGPVVAVDRPVLGIRLGDAGTAELTWDGAAILQVSPTIVGPWSDVSEASSPFSTSLDADAFFRLIVE